MTLARPSIATHHAAGHIGKCMMGVLKGQQCSICESAIKTEMLTLEQMYTQSLEFDPDDPSLIYANKQLWSVVHVAQNLFESHFVETQSLHSKSLKGDAISFLTTNLNYTWLHFPDHASDPLTQAAFQTENGDPILPSLGNTVVEELG
ncbi:Protein of unknown function [Gryllus bimaculatus]|nr:Protein of unknown function [Gryllus bimaculatus]